MSDDKRAESPSMLSYKDRYPDAAGLLTFKPLSAKDIKNDCLIVLDTNVLLAPYQTSPKTLEEVRNIYKKLVGEKRLFLPAHVVREFAHRRPNVIKNLRNTLEKRIEQQTSGWVHQATHSILQDHDDFKALTDLEAKTSRHIEDVLSQYVKDAQTNVDRLLEEIDRWQWDDPIAALYREAFTNEIVSDIEMDEKELLDDAKRRKMLNVPPGLTDDGKAENAAGDLIIWHTILAIAKREKSNVLFVCQEKKDDWWFTAKKSTPIYARFELIDGFRRETSGKSFNIVNFSDFLDLFDANREAIAEVEREAAEAFTGVEEIGTSSEAVSRLSKTVTDPVFQWIYPRIGRHISVEPHTAPPFDFQFIRWTNGPTKEGKNRYAVKIMDFRDRKAIYITSTYSQLRDIYPYLKYQGEALEVQVLLFMIASGRPKALTLKSVAEQVEYGQLSVEGQGNESIVRILAGYVSPKLNIFVSTEDFDTASEDIFG